MRSGSIHTYHDGAVCLLKKCYGFGKGFFLQVEHVLPINRCAWCEFLRVATRMTSSSAVRRSQFHMHFTSQFGSFHIQVLGPRLWIRLCNFVFVSSAMCWTCTFRKKRPFPISSQKNTSQTVSTKPSKNHHLALATIPPPLFALKSRVLLRHWKKLREKYLQGATSLPKVVLLANDPKQVARLTVRSHPGQGDRVMEVHEGFGCPFWRLHFTIFGSTSNSPSTLRLRVYASWI